MFILKYGTILNFPRKIITKISFIKELLFPFVSAGVCWIIDNFNNTLQSIEIKLDKEDL